MGISAPTRLVPTSKTMFATRRDEQSAAPSTTSAAQLPDTWTRLETAARLGHRYDQADVYPQSEPSGPSSESSLPPANTVLQRHTTQADDISVHHGEVRLPQPLKAVVERLSGRALDDVSVHYNSLEPANFGALAYTQGREIHVGPGQEKHLPHEAWHVVQQKQGRVSATRQLKGTGLNDNIGLEQEAIAMGQRANSESGHAPGCGCAGCQPLASPEAAPSQAGYAGGDSASAIQLMCERGHPNHSPGPCPDASGHIKKEFLDRTKDLGVKLGKKHKAGQGPADKRKTTAKVAERLSRHMNAALEGLPSKATMTGMAGKNIAWTVNRTTAEKQESHGPRHVLQHIGGGGPGDPLDFFEDEEAGPMSDTEDESEEYD